MRKLLLSMVVLCMTCLGLSAQEDFAHKVEFIVKQGATDVSIGFNAKKGSKVKINWGDGTPLQEVTAKWDGYGVLAEKVTHTYATALAENTIVTIDASDIMALRDGGYTAGNVIGIAALDAPNLVAIEMRYTKLYASQKIDLSGYNLQKIVMNNVKEVVLPPASEDLKEIVIKNMYSTDLGENDPEYACLTVDRLDLSTYAKLEKLDLQNQNIKEVNVSGLEVLNYLVISRSNLHNLYGAKELKKLAFINVSGNYLSFDQIPLQGSATYHTYFQNAYPMEGHHFGLVADLSHLAVVKNAEGQDVNTVFTPWWHKDAADYSGEAIPQDMYVVENGKITFKEAILNGQESREVEIRMTNEVYPKITISSYFPYATEAFSISKPSEEKVFFDWSADPIEDGIVRVEDERGREVFAGNILVGTQLTFYIKPWEGKMIKEFKYGSHSLTQADFKYDALSEEYSYTIRIMSQEEATVQITFANSTYKVEFSTPEEIPAGSLVAFNGETAISSGDQVAGKTEIRFSIDSSVLDEAKKEVDYWLVNGNKKGEGRNPLVLTITENVTVSAVLKEKGNEPKQVAFSVKTEPKSDTGLDLATFILDVKAPGKDEYEMAFDYATLTEGSEVILKAMIMSDFKELYDFVKIMVNGKEVEHTIEPSLDMPTARFKVIGDTEVVFVYSKKDLPGFIINYSVKEGKGTLTCTGTDGVVENGSKVPYSESIEFVATPDDGYEIAYWEMDGEKKESKDSQQLLSFLSGESHDVKVVFALKNSVDAVAGASVSVRLEGTTLLVEGDYKAAISIYDAMGRLVLTTTEHKVDLTTIASGAYFVQVGAAVYKVLR